MEGGGDDVVSKEINFEGYISPIRSTDYDGIEKVDIRLADRKWRLNNLYTVINEAGELVKFQLRSAQNFLLDNLHYKNIILKARQLGFTTFICIFLLDYALFNQNKSIGVIGPTVTDTGVIFRKIKISWENFPKELKEYMGLGTVGDSKVEYEFTNGSVMRISTSLRSGTYQAVLITEFGKISAHWPDKADEIVTGTLPAVPSKGLVFIESTAEGEDGRFYEFCQDSMEAKRFNRALTVKDYKFFFFPWYENPSNVIEGELDIPFEVTSYLDKMENFLHINLNKQQRNWYYLENKIQKGKMKQEHPSYPDEAFLSSGNKLFNGEKVQAQIEAYKREPIEIDGNFLIYARYNKAHLYGLGADVSQGVKRDSSTIVIIDFTLGEVVMTYKSNEIDPVTFAHDIRKAGFWYGGCVAAPEANNVGLTTCVTLNNLSYPNIYTQVRAGELQDSATNKLGWLTTSLTKPRMMYELSESIDDDILRIPDEGVLLEAKKFNKEDSLEIIVNEKTTRHFDLLTACAIAWQMRTSMTRGRASAEEESRVTENRNESLTKQTSDYS